VPHNLITGFFFGVSDLTSGTNKEGVKREELVYTLNENRGFVCQVIGPVVDVKFENLDCALPKVNEAIRVEDDASGEDSRVVVCEVQQLLGSREVRAVAMTSTDGLRRYIPVLATGAPN